MLMASMHANGQIACRYEVVATIQGPNCPFVGISGLTATAIRPNGLYVTGWHAQCEINNDAFIWIGPPPGTRITIPRPAGIESAHGQDVNDSGVVTGICWQSGKLRGFVWKHQSGQWITLTPPMPNGQVQALAINNANTVVGHRSTRNDVVPTEAFIWNESTGFEGLGVMNGPRSGATDISENNVVVGWTGFEASPFYEDVRAFVHQNGVTEILPPVPEGLSSMARAVNSKGHVAIQGKTQALPVALYEAYVYEKGTWIGLRTPAGYDRTSPGAITDADLVVGACTNSNKGSSARACIWHEGQVALMSDLVMPVPWNPNLSNGAQDVSADGRVLISGRSTAINRDVGFIVRPIPLVEADTNCDSLVTMDDLLVVINGWGPCAECGADVDHDDVVDVNDLLAVIRNWS